MILHIFGIIVMLLYVKINSHVKISRLHTRVIVIIITFYITVWIAIRNIKLMIVHLISMITICSM